VTIWVTNWVGVDVMVCSYRGEEINQGQAG
jgi:hypothetical protein